MQSRSAPEAVSGDKHPRSPLTWHSMTWCPREDCWAWLPLLRLSNLKINLPGLGYLVASEFKAAVEMTKLNTKPFFSPLLSLSSPSLPAAMLT